MLMTEIYDVKCHVPARLAVPGFLNAQRYKATDNNSPSVLALYNLTSPSAASSDEYKALALNTSAAEKAILTRFKSLNRRIYELIYEQHAPGFASPNSGSGVSTPAKHILVVSLGIPSPSKALEAEINKWYNEEHIPDISKSKGWIRTRRFKLESSVELSPNGDSTPHAHEYIAFHEFDHPDIMTDPAFVASGKTEKAEKYMAKVELGVRSFALFKQFN
ncbi:hypothetical protein BJ165DRAFT_1447765 [Panaeolus papilionaceus]|nr:hypothetical protein BJ165DRAFT_1447765 [Panaeolus papilionaceus]